MKLLTYAGIARFVFVMTMSAAASAQIVTSTPAVPDVLSLSPGEVDMRTGEYVAEFVDLSIGPEGAGGFVFVRVPNRTSGFSSNWNYGVSKKPNPSGGSYYQFTNKTIAKTFFSINGTSFSEVSLAPEGLSTLQLLGSGSSRYFVLTTADGKITRYQPSADGAGTGAEEIRHPNGVIYTFAYDTGGPSSARRLRRVSSNVGYQLIYEYYASPNNGKISHVCAFNAAFVTPPSSDTCPSGARRVSYTYSGNRLASVSDATGAVSSITSNFVNSTTPFQESYFKPGVSQAWLTNYYASNTVLYLSQQVFAGGRTINYDFDWVGTGELLSGAVLLGQAWTENGSNTTQVGWGTYQHDSTKLPAVTPTPTSITDPLGRVTKTEYDGAFIKRLSATQPSGLKATYSYNTNRSITQVVQTPSTGSSDPSLTVSYTYDCTVALNCKKPATATDARGNVTNYVYDSVHGGILSETLPAASPGGVRPQTRFTWTQYNAWYRDSSGTLVQAPTPVWLVSSISRCRTQASCAGTADETKTTYSYGTAGTANNLLPTQVTVAAGDGSLSSTEKYTYDANGDRTSEDGPLAGTSDRKAWKYDLMRRLVGAIGPDPDGTGALRFRALRTTYDGAGRAIRVERGTVTGQATSEWTSFVAIQTTDTEFDPLDRPTKVTESGGGTTYSVKQMSYDQFGRAECVATRMNPAVFGSLPTSACSLGAEGTQGPDRITRNYYDAAGQRTKIEEGVGTGDVGSVLSSTYTADGDLQTITDGENNRSTLEYDGHDRVVKMRYPVSTKGALASSSSDFEQYGYDANGNITQRRLRDGQLIGYSYDALDRMTYKDLPSPEIDVSYSDYDLQGHLKTVSQASTWTRSWDALGRLRSEAGPLGTMSYDYDAAGRRTLTRWPDNFYTTQDYYLTNQVRYVYEYAAATIALYQYNDLGSRVSLQRGNGTSTSLNPNALSLIGSYTHDLSGTSQDVTSTLSYNAAMQITANTRSNDVYAWSGSTPNRSDSFNGRNQIPTLAYDARGNLTSSGSDTYTYNAENMMSTGPGGATLQYDPFGRLYQVSKGGVTTRFQYDGTDLVAEYNGSNVLQRRYVHGPGADEPLLWYEGSGLGDRRYLFHDERGSVMAISNGDLVTLGTNTYDAYGTPASTNLGRFSFTGQLWMSEVGLHYYKARFYSPALGRFLQSDPIGYADGLNLYAYAQNDPVNNVDPTGLSVGGSQTSDDILRRMMFDMVLREISLPSKRSPCGPGAVQTPTIDELAEISGGRLRLVPPSDSTDDGDGSGGDDNCFYNCMNERLGDAEEYLNNALAVNLAALLANLPVTVAVSAKGRAIQGRALTVFGSRLGQALGSRAAGQIGRELGRAFAQRLPILGAFAGGYALGTALDCGARCAITGEY